MLEPFDIHHPDVPESLSGLRVLHLSDLHTRRAFARTPRFAHLPALVRDAKADLIVLTGDYVDDPGQEPGAIDVLGAILQHARPGLGVFGVYGNHDTSVFRADAQRLPGVRWLDGLTGAIAGTPLRLLGCSWPEDLLGPMLGATIHPGEFVITLAHYPTAMIPARALGLPMVLAGHTHGGQIRLSPTLAPHTSSDVPPHLASGVIRLGRTLCCISRGLGDGVLEGLRLNCPPQAPLYTLRRGPLPGGPSDRPVQVLAW